ncbi:MAG: hypothetical protein MI920_32600 [Kiloniellales bacterium]|nr:hypothetical protein [Kiloniellales bacterium]
MVDERTIAVVEMAIASAASIGVITLILSRNGLLDRKAIEGLFEEQAAYHSDDLASVVYKTIAKALADEASGDQPKRGDWLRAIIEGGRSETPDED